MIEKTRENQKQVINEVQAEIKSLKNLLLNRRLPAAAEKVTEKEEFVPNIQGFSLGKPAIPAWQLEAAKAKEAKAENDSETKPVSENGEKTVEVEQEA